jgi:hypothetical protein
MESKVFRLNVEEQKMLGLALGELSRSKPDLDFYLSRLATKLDVLELYEKTKNSIL